MDPEQRSAHMSKIRSKNTKPEMWLRKALFRAGYRYRLHERSLPGKPDLVFIGRRKVIFVNGCFWHGHDCPEGLRLPKTNTDFWLEKRRLNRARDKVQRDQLLMLGWKYFDVWECQIKKDPNLVVKVRSYLDG